MIRSFALIAFFSVSIISFPAYAVDLFKLQTLGSQEIQTIQNQKKSFRATINSSALSEASVTINLPHKQLTALRKQAQGAPSEQITPFTLQGQNGSVMVLSNKQAVESVTVYDAASAEVFKGHRQSDGSMLFTQINVDAYICTHYEKHDIGGQSEPQTAEVSYYKNLTNLTLANVTSLQSRPGAPKVLYIDYMAGSVSGTAWNIGNNAPPIINYENYTYDNDASTFSLIDLQSMYAGWAETAEDYAPFDVNVTTDLAVYNAATHLNKSKIISTSTDWFQAGGVAYVDVFGLRNDDFYNIGWTFNKTFSSMGMTNAHESGHQMGLSHDGVGSQDYYDGHGNWGPVMGAPFGQDFVQWSNGSYPGANQLQNDLTIIQGKLGLVADDHGDNNASSTQISTPEVDGFISPAGLRNDIDVFNFRLANTQTINLTVRSLFQQANSNSGDNTAGGLNLSAQIELRDASNVLIQQKSPSSNAANNDFSFSGNLAAGTYYLSIQNQSYDMNSSTGFVEYGNGGFYQILNNIPTIPTIDLIVETPTLGRKNLSPGQAFTLSATVRNQGNSAAGPTMLTYYLSNDPIISAADTYVGSNFVTALPAGAGSNLSISLNAPDIKGDYYYGACVDITSGETVTDNNCSSGVLASEEPVCMPIKAKNGGVSVICL